MTVRAPVRMARAALLRTALATLLLAAMAGASAAADERFYDVLYDVHIVPTRRAADVTIRVRQSQPELRVLRLRIDPERHIDFRGDGELKVEAGSVEWHVPSAGGSLRYSFRIDHQRDELSYDARCAESWALFRADHLVPPASATTRVDARSRARMRLRLPEGWSAATPYAAARNGSFSIENPERGFDRPLGWMVMGKRLGTVRERIAGASVTVAGPAGQGLRRLDILALLRWTLPVLREVAGKLPDRLLVVGAGNPMWRGGLSGPSSLFIHADRPLITPDSTSPILHELAHTVLAPRAAVGDDWITEGLAEFYSLQMLVRSGSIGRKRYERTLERLAAEGRTAKRLQTEHSEGAVTARAVTVLAELDAALRTASQGERSLDDMVRELLQAQTELSADTLRAAAERVAGRELSALFRRHGLEQASAIPARAAPR